jgi:hypothetical protein
VRLEQGWRTKKNRAGPARGRAARFFGFVWSRNGRLSPGRPKCEAARAGPLSDAPNHYGENIPTCSPAVKSDPGTPNHSGAQVRPDARSRKAKRPGFPPERPKCEAARAGPLSDTPNHYGENIPNALGRSQVRPRHSESRWCISWSTRAGRKAKRPGFSPERPKCEAARAGPLSDTPNHHGEKLPKCFTAVKSDPGTPNHVGA